MNSSARTLVRTSLVIVVAGAAFGACRGKSKSNEAAAPAVAPEPVEETAPPPISVPADVTGSYLTCAQTDEPAAAAAPSQPDRVAGELDVAFGCAVAGPDGKKLAGHIDGLTVDAALKGNAARYPITAVATDAQSLWHIVFKLPLHVAQAVTQLDAVVVVDGKSTTLTKKGGAVAADASPLQYIVTVARNEGPLVGGRLLVIRGRGLAGATAVKLGDTACLQTMPSTDHVVACRTAAVTTPAAGLTVTVSTPAGEAKLPNGYSYLAQTKVACDQTLGQPATVVESGTKEAPFLICNREQLLDALTRASDHYLKLVDNIDLYRGGNVPTAPRTERMILDGGGFAVIGLNSDKTVSPTAPGLFDQVDSSDVHDLGILDATIASANHAGALAAEPSNSSFTHLYAAQCHITGMNEVGGLFGHATDIGLESITVENMAVAGAHAMGGIAGYMSQVTTRPFRDLDVTVSLLQGRTCECGGVVGHYYFDINLATTAIERIRVTLDAVGTDAEKIGGVMGFAALANAKALDDLDVRLTTAPSMMYLHAGGIIGVVSANALNCKITNSRVSGHLAVKPVTATIAAGVIGVLATGSVDLTSVTSSVDVDGAAVVAGVLGQSNQSDSKITLRDVLVSGELHAVSNIAGGLVGVASGPIVVDHALVLAHVTGDAKGAAALVGSGGAGSVLSEIYWDSETIGATNANLDGTDVGGKTTKELQKAVTYDAKWKDAWILQDDHYPVLRTP